MGATKLAVFLRIMAGGSAEDIRPTYDL